MRAVVDTSGWVSAVLSRGGRSFQLLRAFEERRFQLISSDPVLIETEEVLERPELVRSGEARRTARALVAAIRDQAEFIAITGTLKVCRDPNDDMVIETAVLGNADVIVSEDKDLLEDPAVIAELARSGIRVLGIAQFLTESDRADD